MIVDLAERLLDLEEEMAEVYSPRGRGCTVRSDGLVCVHGDALNAPQWASISASFREFRASLNAVSDNVRTSRAFGTLYDAISEFVSPISADIGARNAIGTLRDALFSDSAVAHFA